MPTYKDVFHALCEGHSTDRIMFDLKLPPSKLKRILKSSRFREAVECERITLRITAALRSGQWVGEAVLALGQIIEGLGSAARTRAATTILRTATENCCPHTGGLPAGKGAKSLAAMLVQITGAAGHALEAGRQACDKVKKLENTPQNGDETMRIPAALGSSGQAQKA